MLIANALGADILESGALLGYLPALCEHLLGEPLKHALGGDLVVRRGGGAGGRAGESGYPGDQGRIPATAIRSGVRSATSTPQRRAELIARDARPSPQLRRAGAGATVPGAGVGPRPRRAASPHAPSACACSPWPAPTATW
ncbi:MAG: hypothetical protein MZW92_79815 [Comamonadaceae bacterium]|nr:hypothetical protein [Comamonadaceae bacterium]